MPISYTKLFQLMEEKNIKKIDLRTKYGINPKTVNSLTKNRSVTIETMMKLCKILNCNIDDIVEYIPDTYNSNSDNNLDS
ncbi:helix-turn-helix domain-containing protein [Caproiciproducens sp. CPB-2]|uniref:helix-turn-helix domain-containing protein n=1 Tax=Caproiciproducens sp. CPB-2 TaxID=3030017 RepID=UPI0023DB417A|nr:helix-turn-helix transcriptional regulator [Caproiciproducens sp. CPB-2]MDF1496310.1 helix-turn-helix transcriptional regulator [Caproiciproducens sp. CPB-2]